MSDLPILLANETIRYSAAVVLAGFLLVALLIAVLYQTGALGPILRVLFGVAEAVINGGYRVWDRWLSAVSWQVLAGVLVAVHVLIILVDWPPLFTIVLGTGLLFVGASTCLAYMFLDTERYEVSRGYKAVHHPAKGQRLAEGLTAHGERAGFGLLLLAVLCCVVGFSLLNLGLSQSVGEGWYSFGTHPSRERPTVIQRLFRGDSLRTDSYADFLAYTLVNLAYMVDLLDLANKQAHAGIAFVRTVAWPASTLLVLFRLFFSFVLLQQLVSLVRHGRLLGESVQDLWSPYKPIQQRAMELFQRQGPDAVPVLLSAIESMAPLTADQRALLPEILGGIGPAAVPLLRRGLVRPEEDVQAVAVLALGKLKAWWALPELDAAATAGSPVVRQAVAKALGEITGLGVKTLRKQWSLGRATPPRRRWRVWRRQPPVPPAPPGDPVELSLAILMTLLADADREVRVESARALLPLGEEAAPAAPRLLALAREEDEELRAAAARALGVVEGPVAETVQGLVGLLEPPIPSVLVAALESLGRLGAEASAAVPAIVPLLRHEQGEVREAAAAAINRIGHLDAAAVPGLVEGLADADDLIRARAAEALGTIGPSAAPTGQALAEVVRNDANDRVRERAAWALGQLGPDAADESVHVLARALSDGDSSVVVAAAEALGALGDAAASAVPELRQSLGHINPTVRRAVAAALGAIGGLEPADVRDLTPLIRDEDPEVRRQVALTLGTGDLPGVVEALLNALSDEAPEVRTAAVQGLAGRPGEPVTAKLVKLLDDPAIAVQVEAVRALAQRPDAGPEVVTRLVAMLEDQPDAVRAAAAAALGLLGEAARPAASALQKLFQTGTAPLREAAIKSLVQIEPADAYEAYAAGLRDPEASVRRLASAGLLKLKELPPEVVTVLPEGLTDPDVRVCSNIAQVCSRLETLPAELVPLLLNHTASTDDGLRLAAVRALRNVPITGGEENLTRLLEDPNPQIALLAACFLMGQGAGIEGLAATFSRALGSGSAYRNQALAALVEADPAIPGLKELLGKVREDVSDDEVRVQLDQALARLAEAPPAPGPLTRLLRR